MVLDHRLFLLSMANLQLTVEEYLKNGYNEYEAQICALKELQAKFDIEVKEAIHYGI